MRVKTLELFGFKSFPTKTTIHFEPGVTAIVGPNGVGKSNCVDAIRWVLGEHNPRDVRAPRLEDVIFNGTDQRAPLSMAEVHLTIENQQGLLPIAFTEVTITRRVYRSGESEFAINQAPCRLKDIQELFLGTGLGGGTYAIIEQGHIDLVLSSKPEERRIVFEEASGIAKYLAKKQETIRRLNEVEEHLVRIADIAGEVRRQVSALERQASKARQYQAQWEQLKGMELRLAADELRQGGTRDRELEQRLEGLEAQRATLEAQKQTHIGSLESCHASVSAGQQQAQELRTKLVGVSSQITQHEAQVSLKTRWIEELTQQAKQLELEDAQLHGRLQQFDEQMARTKAAAAQLQEQLETLRGQHRDAGQQVREIEATIQQARATIEEAKAQLFDAASEATHHRNTLTELTGRLQTIHARLGRLDGQRSQLTTRTEDVRNRLHAATQDGERLRAQCDEIQQRTTATGRTLEEATARREDVTQRLHQARETLAGQRAHLTCLEDLWRRFEGFPDAVKTLMGQSVQGVLGPLVDLIQASPGYEAIVEAALGPLAEAVVVQDRKALTRCRQLLTAKQLQSCRFLVLEDCPASMAAMEQPGQQGVAGAVKQFIRTEAPYQPLVDWLLNDSWVIDDIERLLRERALPQRRLVSLMGDRWDRRSWRFNGSRNGDRRLLGRKQRWDEAQVKVQSLEREVGNLETAAQEAQQQWQSLLAQQESDKGQLAHMRPNLQKLEGLVEQLTAEARRIEEEQRAGELEIQELLTQQQELGEAVTRAEQVRDEAQRRQQTLERALADAQAAREAAEQRKQETLIANAQVDASLQSLADRLQGLTTRREELETDRTHLQQQREQKTRQRTEAIRRCEELNQQLEGHRQGSQQLAEEQVVLQQEAERVSAALREAQATRDQVMPQVLAVEQQLAALLQQMQQQQQQLTERTFRRSHLIERLRELYQIDEVTITAEARSDAPPLPEEERAQMTQRVQTLRTKLEGIGPVSLGSVEEYDELKRRHEFLEDQQQDLMRARDDLKSSIAKINRTARSQFRETFAKIQEAFKHYFARLFSGGEADLLLVDEDDVLESGIEIVVQPPGKRLQSISLLSGGERALTAIALLFALFKVRPSPFCILDEIDAPLDEANVDRFTKVLEEFLSLSQFTLITHNKKTITKADSLYGVTMEEAGVSKILSAKLTS